MNWAVILVVNLLFLGNAVGVYGQTDAGPFILALVLMLLLSALLFAQHVLSQIAPIEGRGQTSYEEQRKTIHSP